MCRVGDYKLIQGEPGRFFDWFSLPEDENAVAPTQYPTWKRRPWTPHMFPDYQLYNIKGVPRALPWVRVVLLNHAIVSHNPSCLIAVCV